MGSMIVQIVDKTGEVIGEVKNCKTIKGALTQIKKSSIALHKGWKLRIEHII
jgi:hypothetical protein